MVDAVGTVVGSIKVQGFKDFDEQLFDVLAENGRIPVFKLTSILESMGLLKTDPRLKECVKKLREAGQVSDDYDGKDALLNKETFCECINSNIVLIRRAFAGGLVLRRFPAFRDELHAIYVNCRQNRSGKVPAYTPQLGRYSADDWGMTVCSTDGQRYSEGDVKTPFSMHSLTKPIMYSLVVSDLGEEHVHRYIGREPSGESFNNIKLGHDNKPHNPMISAGAIVTTSLLKRGMHIADRFDKVINEYRRLAGGERLGFNNAVFLSEKESSERNYALAYYLKENKCFPEGTNIHETLDFFMQLCAIEITCESGAVIAATLANGGICPLTGEQVLEPTAVRNTLSLMHSCGMYDYSGEFAFKVGLPAKSGKSGVILLIVPDIAGFCLWSPPLDRCGKSSRGIQFCEEVVRRFSFHHYGNLKNLNTNLDHRHGDTESDDEHVVQLLFAAASGDVTALQRMTLAGADMSVTDYDGRTALHVAAADGNLDCVKFLIEKCDVVLEPRDRWCHTPFNDATQFGHEPVAEYLRDACVRQTPLQVRRSSSRRASLLDKDIAQMKELLSPLNLGAQKSPQNQ